MPDLPHRAPNTATHETAYEGRDLALDIYDGGHPVSIVTFEARNKYISALTPSPFGGGFGRGRFATMGFNEYLVKRSRNHWYQTSEIEEVAEIIRERTRGTRVLTYGSSMGAFAAINFAVLMNADRFIAISPLHDVSVGNAAGDGRWIESQHLDFSHNLIREGEAKQAQGYVFYSHDGYDEKHAELIMQHTAATLVPVEYGRHPCSFYLNATYGLKRIVAEVAADSFELDPFYRVLGEKTLETHYPYERRAVELAKAGDTDAAIAQIRIAIEKNPALPRLSTRLGDLLRRDGDIAGAEATYLEVLATHPRNADAHIGISYAHAERGDFAAAADAVRAAIAISPRHEYYSRLGEWLIRLGDLAAAEQAVLKVIELVPHAKVAPMRLEEIRRRTSAREPSRPVAAPARRPWFSLLCTPRAERGELAEERRVSSPRGASRAPRP